MKKGYWILIGVVVLVLVIVGIIVFSEKESSDRRYIKDSFYREYSIICNDLDDEDLSFCENASMCIADVIVDNLNDEEIIRVKIALEEVDGDIKKAGEDFSNVIEKMGEERLMAMSLEMAPCSEVISDIMMTKVKSELSEGAACMDAVSEIVIDNNGYTCYDSDTGKVNVQVSRGTGDFELVGIQVLVSEGENEFTEKVTKYLPESNEEKIIYVSYIGSVVDEPEGVAIAPIVLANGDEKVCGISSSATIEEC